jgi:hypothetical protein
MPLASESSVRNCFLNPSVTALSEFASEEKLAQLGTVIVTLPDIRVSLTRLGSTVVEATAVVDSVAAEGTVPVVEDVADDGVAATADVEIVAVETIAVVGTTLVLDTAAAVETLAVVGTTLVLDTAAAKTTAVVGTTFVPDTAAAVETAAVVVVDSAPLVLLPVLENPEVLGAAVDESPGVPEMPDTARLRSHCTADCWPFTPFW